MDKTEAPLPTLVEWEAHTCGACGVPFAASIDFFNDRRKTGRDFFCPNGHIRVYRETDADRLRRQLAEKERLLASARESVERANRSRVAAEHSARTTKGHMTRLRNRAKRGECLACGTVFKNLRRHMARVHPTFDPEAAHASP